MISDLKVFSTAYEIFRFLHNRKSTPKNISSVIHFWAGTCRLIYFVKGKEIYVNCLSQPNRSKSSKTQYRSKRHSQMFWKIWRHVWLKNFRKNVSPYRICDNLTAPASVHVKVLTNPGFSRHFDHRWNFTLGFKKRFPMVWVKNNKILRRAFLQNNYDQIHN